MSCSHSVMAISEEENTGPKLEDFERPVHSIKAFLICLLQSYSFPIRRTLSYDLSLSIGILLTRRHQKVWICVLQQTISTDRFAIETYLAINYVIWEKAALFFSHSSI